MAGSNVSSNAGSTNGSIERRRHRRMRTDTAVELIWKEGSYRRFECGSTVDATASGAGILCPQPINVLSYLILRAPGLAIVALSQVRSCVWRRTQYQLG